jgi:hypothetical protein
MESDSKVAKARTPKPSSAKYDVGRKLGNLKRKLSAYNRVKDKCMAAIKEGGSVNMALECYRLIRNFCITYNFIASQNSTETYLYIPKDFENDFKTLLSEDNMKKFLEAM